MYRDGETIYVMMGKTTFFCTCNIRTCGTGVFLMFIHNDVEKFSLTPGGNMSMKSIMPEDTLLSYLYYGINKRFGKAIARMR